MMARVLGWARYTAVAVALVAGSAYADDSNSIALGVGTQKIISVGNISRIALGDPSVADVKAIGSNQILIVGSAEGKTTLIIWRSNGQRLNYLISVRKTDPNEVIGEIRKLLGDREGITIRMVGDRIYLDGQAYTSEDNDRVQQIVSSCTPT